jgi:hypothetical protein
MVVVVVVVFLWMCPCPGCGAALWAPSCPEQLPAGALSVSLCIAVTEWLPCGDTPAPIPSPGAHSGPLAIMAGGAAGGCGVCPVRCLVFVLDQPAAHDAALAQQPSAAAAVLTCASLHACLGQKDCLMLFAGSMCVAATPCGCTHNIYGSSSAALGVSGVVQ